MLSFFTSWLLRRKLGRQRELYSLFADLLQIVPGDLSLYETAFRHTSVVASAGPDYGAESNERLEYLGDAVIELAVSEYLYGKGAHWREGELTQLRSRIVSRESINGWGRAVALSRFLHHDFNGSIPDNVHGNAFEALFGALFLDKGYIVARNVLWREFLGKRLDLEKVMVERKDWKSRVFELSQRGHFALDLRVERQGSRFCAELRMPGCDPIRGYGDSKKKAEQLVCQAYIERYVNGASNV